ncbi:ribbon-helix-helix protein, CopG family [Rhodoglobus vestalii]|uniref:type II toxin-antitoxin system RelE family toxin n=1 Tax=Rhodoglobus vestalii TaxID=193384 RepID=UPI00114D64C0
MSYRVEFTAAAARQVRKLPRPARDRVIDARAARESKTRSEAIRDALTSYVA